MTQSEIKSLQKEINKQFEQYNLSSAEDTSNIKMRKKIKESQLIDDFINFTSWWFKYIPELEAEEEFEMCADIMLIVKSAKQYFIEIYNTGQIIHDMSIEFEGTNIEYMSFPQTLDFIVNNLLKNKTKIKIEEVEEHE